MMDKLHCPECGIEIDEHPAGRCLDAWVAITIMNWKYAPKTDPKIKLWLYWRRPDGMLKYEPPEYSTDIAAAWEVVEKITEPPKDIETSRRMSNTIFSRWFDTANLWACSASEASLEICRAVIKAVLR